MRAVREQRVLPVSLRIAPEDTIPSIGIHHPEAVGRFIRVEKVATFSL